MEDINNNQNGNSSQNHQQQQMIHEAERFMPIANISRIMKRVLPEQAKLSKESKECIQECITEFILFITSEAAEKCETEKRKTINGEDLLVSMETLGFENNFLLPLKAMLRRYKEANRSEKPSKNEVDESSIENGKPLNPEIQYPKHAPRQSQPNVIPEAAQTIKTQPEEQQKEDSEDDILKYLPSNFRRAKEIYIDTVTQQYYIFATLPDGTKGLLPIELRSTLVENK